VEIDIQDGAMVNLNNAAFRNAQINVPLGSSVEFNTVTGLFQIVKQGVVIAKLPVVGAGQSPFISIGGGEPAQVAIDPLTGEVDQTSLPQEGDGSQGSGGGGYVNSDTSMSSILYIADGITDLPLGLGVELRPQAGADYTGMRVSLQDGGLVNMNNAAFRNVQVDSPSGSTIEFNTNSGLFEIINQGYIIAKLPVVGTGQSPAISIGGGASAQVSIDPLTGVVDQSTLPRINDISEQAVVAGDSVIDLGEYGQLIHPVQVEGKWYYAWDLNGDGEHSSASSSSSSYEYDHFGYSILNDIFTQDANGNINPDDDVNNTYRYGTINGVQLALPTLGEDPARIQQSHNGTAVNDGQTINTTYDDLLAVWDAHNGTATGSGWEGVPDGWHTAVYHTATPSPNGHADIYLRNGFVYDVSPYDVFAALEVIPTEQAEPVPTSPTAFIYFDETKLSPGDSTNVTIEFSENVMGFDNNDLFVTGGTLTPVTTYNGKKWYADFTVSESTLLPFAQIKLLAFNNLGPEDSGYVNWAGKHGSAYREDILTLAENGNSDAQWVAGTKTLNYYLNKDAFADPYVALKYAAYQDVKSDLFASSELSEIVKLTDGIVSTITNLVDIIKNIASLKANPIDNIGAVFDATISIVESVSKIIYPEQPAWISSIVTALKMVSGSFQENGASAAKELLTLEAGVINQAALENNESFAKITEFSTLAIEKILDSALGNTPQGIVLDIAAESAKIATQLYATSVLIEANDAAVSRLIALSYLDAYYATNGNPELMEVNFNVDYSLNDFAEVAADDEGWFTASLRDAAIEKTIQYVDLVEATFAEKVNNLKGVPDPDSYSVSDLYDIQAVVDIVGVNSMLAFTGIS
jgi:hypothetical protein